MQNDPRMRKARGPWWHVVVLGGGGVLAPESLAKRLRRASIDDLVSIYSGYEASGRQAILRHVIEGVRDAGVAKQPRKKAKRTESRTTARAKR